MHTYTYISYIKRYAILVSLLINKRWKGWIIRRGAVFMCILNVLRHCHGELFLGRRAAVLFAETPPFHPARRIFDPACHRQLRAPPKRQNPRTAEAAFENQNHELTYFDHGGKRGIRWERARSNS